MIFEMEGREKKNVEENKIPSLAQKGSNQKST